MKIRIALFAVVGLTAFVLSNIPVVAGQEPAPAAPPTEAPAAAAPKTTWDAVYTQAQATKGGMVYDEKCVRCHGVDGSGADAPTLVGADFATSWDGLSLYQLFDRTRSSMPQDDPGSMSREDTTALLAYILQKNGFPAGEADLASGADVLNVIKYTSVKP